MQLHKVFRRTILAWLLALSNIPVHAEVRTADVVIYGGTSAGVVAAIQTARMGKTVLLIEPRLHIGGLSTSGLSMTDSGNKAVIGGLSREFYQRIKRKYDDPARWPHESRDGYEAYNAQADAMWKFEPHVASEVFHDLLREAGVTPILGTALDKVRTAGSPSVITQISLSNGDTVRGLQFIDATYEGDLMAAALTGQGTNFVVGRESNSTYGETLNGVQVAQATKHQFIKNVDPFRIKGDQQSGLLPGIGDDPGIDGQADHRLQAFNYRLCVTDVKANQIPFTRPEGYDPLEFELLLRNFEAEDMRLPLHIQLMPNRKTDINNNFAVSTDYIGMNYDYPNAPPARRREIEQQHELYTRGLLWTLANHPRVPQSIRTEMSRWGWARDEWVDHNNWSPWIYIREARRMVGDYVQTELDCKRQRVCDDPVGLGSYNMDSHHVQRYVNSEGFVRNEGDVQVSPGGPYLISYRAIVPRREVCGNLFVPVCLSSSHIAYGSIRMEPVFMILGQSAATAACLSIDKGCPVQALPYAELRERLIADRQILDLPAGSVPAGGIDPKTLPGLVIDDTQAIKTGTWTSSTSVPRYIGTGYLHDSFELPGDKSVHFPIQVPRPGRYEVRVAYGANANRSSRVKHQVRHGAAVAIVVVDQRQTAPIDKTWFGLGTFQFAGLPQEGVTILNDSADGYVIADAVQLLPLP